MSTSGERATYEAGDTVIKYSGATGVGHVLTEEQAASLNQGGSPPTFGGWEVRRTDEPIHYFPNCAGKEYDDLSWSIQDTTCETCLMGRATALSGWRWTHPSNTKEVAFLKSKLGERVEGMGDQQNPYCPEER